MKKALAAPIGVAILALAGCRAGAPAAAKTVKVGIILTYSGPDASIGEAIDRGAELYRTLHRTDLPAGVELQLIKRDETGPTPDVAKRLARELIVREGVQLLTGGQWTPNVSAIAPLVTEAGIPYLVMSSGTASTTRLSPFIVRVAFTTWQHSYHLGRWVASNGMRRASTIVSDYAAGVDSEEAFVRGFTEAGGAIVSSIRAPVRTADYVPFLERVRRDKPQALFNFNPGGPEATRFVKAYHDLGLAAAGVQLVGPNAVVPDDELKNMGDAALGVISASHYSAAGDRPANRTFVAEWKKAYGADSLPNYFAVGGWDGMAAIFAAIRAQEGTLDPTRTRDFLAHWSNAESPRGPMQIDPDTRDVIQNVYIRRVEKVDGELRNVEFATIPSVKDPWKELHPSPTS
ncbi:MAG: ABC transporter substrate-binding protein [Acidobacteria bacterium]|nr:ABC transporter substrate-binding protein [Acidobacteriota bacterium]